MFTVLLVDAKSIVGQLDLEDLLDTHEHMVARVVNT